jgi:hypothetical protein
VLGTYDEPVGGTLVGAVVIITANTPGMKSTAAQYFNGYKDLAINPAPVGDELAVECQYAEVAPGKEVVSCNGEGGPALYGLVKGPKFDMFLDGYSRGFSPEVTDPMFTFDEMKDFVDSFTFS